MMNGVTGKTPSRIPFGAGFYFSGVPYSEKVAPTEEAMRAGVLGATQEGGSLNITPVLFKPELDDVWVDVMELEKKMGETAQMEVSFAELTAQSLAHSVIGNVGETTDKKYDVVTSSTILRAGHYYEGFGFCGQLYDGRQMIIVFKRALCTNGFPFEPKPKTNNLWKGTFACRSDLEYGTTKLPYAIFIHKEEGWVAVDPDEVAVAA